MFEKYFNESSDDNTEFEEQFRDFIQRSKSTSDNCNEKLALFTQMKSVLSKNTCLWFSDDKLYQKLFKCIAGKKSVNNKTRPMTEYKTLSKDTTPSSDEITIENNAPADTLLSLENSEQFGTDNDEHRITSHLQPTICQQTAKSDVSNNYYSDEQRTSENGKKKRSKSWYIVSG